MTLSPQRLEKAAEALIEREFGSDAKAKFGDHYDELKEGAISDVTQTISAYLGDAHVDVPREPTWPMQIAGRDAILEEDDKLDLSTDDARAAYLAMLSASLTERDAG